MTKKIYISLILVFPISLTFFLVRFWASDVTKKGPEKMDSEIKYQESKIQLKKNSYSEAVKSIQEGWKNFRIGDTFFANGEYEKAVLAYEKAYLIERGGLFGITLAKSYERVGRYDDGITLLDQMIINNELSAAGIKNANEIKARLLAAKNTKYRTQSQREALERPRNKPVE